MKNFSDEIVLTFSNGQTKKIRSGGISLISLLEFLLHRYDRSVFQHLTEINEINVTELVSELVQLKQNNIINEDLRKWFREKWVRFNPQGKIMGHCARGADSEGKPKCLPQSKAHSLGKKGRSYAASKKRREDPNPERKGAAINVATKKRKNESQDISEGRMADLAADLEDMTDSEFFEEYGMTKDEARERFKSPPLHEKHDMQSHNKCPNCGGELISEELINEKKDACYYKVKSRYKVWPSAYASGALVKCRKAGAKNWGKSVKESHENNKLVYDVAYDFYDTGKLYTNTMTVRANNEQEATKVVKELSEGKNYRVINSEQNITETKSSAQQAAIAISIKKAGKKPKSIKENTSDDIESIIAKKMKMHIDEFNRTRGIEFLLSKVDPVAKQIANKHKIDQTLIRKDILNYITKKIK